MISFLRQVRSGMDQEEFLVDPECEPLKARSLDAARLGSATHLPSHQARLASVTIQLGSLGLQREARTLDEAFQNGLARAQTTLSIIKNEMKAQEDLIRHQRLEYLREIQAAREEKNKAEAQRSKYYEQLKSLQESHELEKKQSVLLKAKVELLTGEKDTFDSKLEKVQQENASLKNSLTTIELLKEEAEKQAHEFGDQIHPLKQQIERLAHDKQLLQDQCTLLSRLHEDSSSTLEDAMTRLKTVQNGNLGLVPKDEKPSFEKDLFQLESDYDALQEDIREFVKIVNGAQSLLPSYELDLDTLASNVRDLKEKPASQALVSTHRERLRLGRLILNNLVSQIYRTISS